MLMKIIILIYLSIVEAKIFKTNFTDFHKCQIYYSKSGNIYKDFFELSEQSHTNGSLLDFHFSVLSSSDAHILLAPSNNIEKGAPVYEIVIGAGGNTFCDIRRMQKSAVKASIRITGLLSKLDIKSFWIHISQEGVIDIGKEGEELGFLNWIDPDPLPLKVFSFSTWPGIEAKWFFNCPLHQNDNKNNSNKISKEIERKLTDLDKLRRDLIYYYDPFVRPTMNTSYIIPIQLKIQTNFINLDEHKAYLYFKGHINMQWNDEKLIWNTSTYGGIKNIHIFRREIWVPHLYCYNCIDNDMDILEDTLLTVNSSGFVNWMTSIHLRVWCDPDDLGNWPDDIHTCEIILGFYKDFNHLQLIFNANESLFNLTFYPYWKIIMMESTSNIGWMRTQTNQTINSTNSFDPPSLTLKLKLKRNSESFKIILFTPFFVISITLLLTFWVSPYGYLKILLACFQLILATIVLLGLGLIIPIHSKFVPDLVSLYSYSLTASLTCIFLTIIVINLTRNQQNYSVPHCIGKILTSCILKGFLCLPQSKMSDEYGNLNDSFSKINENHQLLWISLGMAIDRVSFIVYLGLILYGFLIIITH